MSSAGPRRLAWGAPTSWRRCRVRRTLPWHIHRPPCWSGTGGREPHLRPRRCARGRSSSWPDAVDPHAGSGSLPWRAQDLRVPRPSGRDAVPHHDACPASRGRHGTGQPTRREDRPLPTHAARRCPPRNGEWSCCAPIKAPCSRPELAIADGEDDAGAVARNTLGNPKDTPPRPVRCNGPVRDLIWRWASCRNGVCPVQGGGFAPRGVAGDSQPAKPRCRVGAVRWSVPEIRSRSFHVGDR